MAKNNLLINSLKAMQYKLEAEVTNIYGGLAIALHRIGIPADQIAGLFEMTDDIWNYAIENDINMTDMARDEVGIDIHKAIKNGTVSASRR